jgi:2-alkyl-3-oxoalkanoate reductase
MRVFVTGASGAIGTRLVPQLIDRGHEVIGTYRSPGGEQRLRALGATPIQLDLLDARAVRQAVLGSEPEAIVHEATALANVRFSRNLDKSFAETNRLRTEGTDALLSAAREAGVRRFVAQSFASMRHAREGAWVKTEDDPLDPNPPARQRRSMAAIRYLEDAVAGATDIDGLALRYGGFYGPGSNMSAHGEIADLVRKRRFPIVGEGSGVWSFCHLEDAASATVAAVERGAPGIYNVCDDEPVEIATWLPEYARTVGAPAPRHVPVWLGRLLAGEVVVSMMTQIRGASNVKAKATFDWKPRYATYRDGFRTGLGGR